MVTFVARLQPIAAHGVHLGYTPGHHSGFVDRVFGWIVHAAVWQATSQMFHRFPLVAAIGMLLIVVVALVVLRWVRARFPWRVRDGA